MSTTYLDGRIKTGVLTVSDRCFRLETEDTSGKNLEDILRSKTLLNAEVMVRLCVPDDEDSIKDVLVNWCDVLKLDLVLTTGGTGFSERDVTPEATRAVITKEAPGMSVAMIQKSLEVTPMAMLSRLICGIRKQTLIINLPGSRKGSQECLQFASPAIPHAIDQLRDHRSKIADVHASLADSQPVSTTTKHFVCDCSSTEPQNKPPENYEHRHTSVASRPRHSPYPLISVSEAQAIVVRECIETGKEEVSFQVACGRILAEDVRAPDPLPPFPASIKDGYAVIGDLTFFYYYRYFLLFMVA